jgi:hypothetical protein
VPPTSLIAPVGVILYRAYFLLSLPSAIKQRKALLYISPRKPLIVLVLELKA